MQRMPATVSAADRAYSLRVLADGYASNWDRRTAAWVRRNQRDGVPVSAEQVRFAEQVEAAVQRR